MSNHFTAVIAAVIAMGLSSLACASDDKSADIGTQEFQDKCASCHGLSGKGDGALAVLLRKTPSDLTILSKTNGGVFPFGKVYEVIDGRKLVSGHGDRQMPVWGREYLKEDARAAAYLREGGYRGTEMETFVRLRILALIDYLHRIQVK